MSDIFLESFFYFSISLNSLFNSLKCFHMLLSIFLEFSWVFFDSFQKYIFFNNVWTLLFSFFSLFSYLFFIDLFKIINVCRFLFVNIYFILYVFHYPENFPILFCSFTFWKWCENGFSIWKHASLWNNKSLEKHWNEHTARRFCSSKNSFSNPCSYFHLPLKN